MLVLHRTLLSAVALGVVAVASAGVVDLWQDLTGELEGDFVPLSLEGAPMSHWKAVVTEGRTVVVAVDGVGTRIRAEVALTPARSLTCRLREAELDLARWMPALAPKLLPAAVDLLVTGTLSLRGEGAIGATPTGAVSAEVRDATLSDRGGAWSIRGITVRGAFPSLPAVDSAGPIQVAFRECTVGGITAQDGTASVSIDADRHLVVHSAGWRMLGGAVSVSPFVVAPTKPALDAEVHFTGVALDTLVRFLPSLLAEARGPVSGRVEVHWTRGEGITLANGSLRPRADEVASVRLTAAPGFLTSRLPSGLRERIDLLPTWLGPIRRLFMPKNPAYGTLRDIELGRIPLVVQALDLDIRPGGDSQGRTARVVLNARPAVQTSVVESVRFEINVTGQLADLLRLGLEGRLSVHLR